MQTSFAWITPRRLADLVVLSGQLALSASFITWALAACSWNEYEQGSCDNGYGFWLWVAAAVIVPFAAGLAMPSRLLAWGLPIAGFIGVNATASVRLLTDFFPGVNDPLTAWTLVAIAIIYSMLICLMCALLAVAAYLIGESLHHRLPPTLSRLDRSRVAGGSPPPNDRRLRHPPLS